MNYQQIHVYGEKKIAKDVNSQKLEKNSKKSQNEISIFIHTSIYCNI